MYRGWFFCNCNICEYKTKLICKGTDTVAKNPSSHIPYMKKAQLYFDYLHILFIST